MFLTRNFVISPQIHTRHPHNSRKPSNYQFYDVKYVYIELRSLVLYYITAAVILVSVGIMRT